MDQPYHSPPIIPPIDARTSIYGVDNLSTKRLSSGQFTRFIALLTVLFVLFWLILAIVATKTWSRVELRCEVDPVLGTGNGKQIVLYFGLFQVEIDGCCKPPSASGEEFCLPCDRTIQYTSGACSFGFCKDADWAGIMAGIAWLGQLIAVVAVVLLLFFFRRANIRVHDLPGLVMKGFSAIGAMSLLSYLFWHAGAQPPIDDFVDSCKYASVEYSNISTSVFGCLFVWLISAATAALVFFRIMRNRENYQQFLDAVYRMNDDEATA